MRIYFLYFELFVENLFALGSFLLFFGTWDTCRAENTIIGHISSSTVYK